MRVTIGMINKELRVRGILIRAMLRFRNEKSFVFANTLLRKFLHWKFPSDMNAEERFIPRQDGGLLRIVVCRPADEAEAVTGVLWLHGGGYAFGRPEQELHYAREIMGAAPAVIVIPDYRLSVQAPYPAALEDAYTALLWLKEHAAELGVNADQIFVAGESAGGGLTACLTAYARDKGEVAIAFQMPLYPMLDDRMNTPSAVDNNAPMWDSHSNRICWKMYLRDLYGTDQVPPYAAPARLKDYSGLPPTYTFVGDIEPFRDETVAYVEELKQAGVPAGVDVFQGCYHAFDMIGADKQIGKAATRAWVRQFKFAAENYYAKNHTAENGDVPPNLS